MPKSLKLKERNCAFENLSLPCGSTKTCGLVLFSATCLSLPMLHVHTACQCCKSFLLVQCPCQCCIYKLHPAASLYCMSMQHVPYMRHAHDVFPCCTYVQHLHAACICCMSMLHAHAVCPCCMSMLHVHAECCATSPCRMFKSSVVDPKLIFFFSGSGSYLDLNFGSGFESGSGVFMKNTLEIQMI